MGADAILSGHPRALSYALNLVIDALSYNKMTLDSGFTAFDVDGDGLISTSDFMSSVDDLQLELDASTIKQMHRSLDVDCDGFIGLGEWISGLNQVQSGGDGDSVVLNKAIEVHMQSPRVSKPAPHVGSGERTPQVPLGLEPAAQAMLALESVRARLASANQERVLNEPACRTVKIEIAAAIDGLNAAIEFDVGRITDRFRDKEIASEKQLDALRLLASKLEQEKEKLEHDHRNWRENFRDTVEKQQEQMNARATAAEAEVKRMNENADLYKADVERLNGEIARYSALVAEREAELEAGHLALSTTKNELSDLSAKFQEMEELLSRTQREVASCKNQLDVERNGHADTKAVLRTKVEELALLKAAARSKTPGSESDTSVVSSRRRSASKSRCDSKSRRSSSATRSRSKSGRARSVSRRASGELSSPGAADKADRTEQERSEHKRRARASDKKQSSKEMALEEISKLKGQLSTYKQVVSNTFGLDHGSLFMLCLFEGKHCFQDMMEIEFVTTPH